MYCSLLTGGHVSEVAPDRLKPGSHQQESSVESVESVINWKITLHNGLGKSSSLIGFERAWAKLCSRMRTLCPETNWISICESCEEIDTRTVIAIQYWLESVIATPEWPFPEQVIISASGGEQPVFRIMLSLQKKTNLPIGKVPNGISVLFWKDNYSHGWLIKSAETFSVNKTGEA